MSEIGMELLERYLAGKASTEECQRADAWLAEDPRRWAELTALRDALEKQELSDRAVEEAVAEVWARLAPEVGATEEPSALVGRPSRQPSREFAVMGGRRKLLVPLLAALVVLTIGGGLVATLLLRPSVPAEATRAATTAPGERATFRLSDGTQVMLGVASTMRYPEAFPDDGREVTLEGEAYFDVVHEEGRPFVVRAGGLIAKDLGTQFTIRAYPEEAGARVVVREGKVAIRAVADSIERVVAPGQLGRLGQGRVPTVELADTGAWFAWTEGRLVFDNIPLREALPQLGRWFDLEFRLADSSMERVPLTATLRTQPTPDVLDNLAASLGMRQRQEGRTVTLYSTDPAR